MSRDPLMLYLSVVRDINWFFADWLQASEARLVSAEEFELVDALLEALKVHVLMPGGVQGVPLHPRHKRKLSLRLRNFARRYEQDFPPELTHGLQELLSVLSISWADIATNEQGTTTTKEVDR